MLITTRAIVLRTVKHSDRTRVLTVWTENFGLRSYLVRTGARGGIQEASIQALNRVELVVQEDPERELNTVRELRVERPYLNLRHDPLRGAVALFLQELLYKVLRTGAAEPSLDAFLREGLETLDTAPDIRNFPLVFVLQLAGHLGFFPEAPAPNEDRFDLREGHFISGQGEHAHTLGPPLSMALASLLDVDLQHQHQATIPAMQRRELMDYLLLYFRMHLEGLGELRSPAVLHQVLG